MHVIYKLVTCNTTIQRSCDLEYAVNMQTQLVQQEVREENFA